jgi:hypothetical protein
MGHNSTFKERRHSYMAALAVEIRLHAIVTNFVVYIALSSNLLHACKFVRKRARRRDSNPSKKI